MGLVRPPYRRVVMKHHIPVVFGLLLACGRTPGGPGLSERRTDWAADAPRLIPVGTPQAEFVDLALAQGLRCSHNQAVVGVAVGEEYICETLKERGSPSILVGPTLWTIRVSIRDGKVADVKVGTATPGP